jgi:hypothetical protein
MKRTYVYGLLGVYRKIKRLLKARTNQVDNWVFVSENASYFVYRKTDDCFTIYKNLNKNTGSVVYRSFYNEII